jgi:hypothetical protein
VRDDLQSSDADVAFDDLGIPIIAGVYANQDALFLTRCVNTICNGVTHDPDEDAVWYTEDDNCPTHPNPLQENGDADTYGNVCDNCDTVSNFDQLNNDADATGDACDNCPTDYNTDQADADGDALGDACDPDDDNDTVADGADNCPLWPNASQVPPNWPVPANDGDCDGFSAAAEASLGTDPTRQCPVAGTPDAWPPDINRSGQVTILDVTGFKPVFGQSGAANPRYNLATASADITILDVLALKPYFSKSCS